MKTRLVLAVALFAVHALGADPDTGSVAGVDSPCVEYGVRYAYDPDNRERAHADLLAFLADIFNT